MSEETKLKISLAKSGKKQPHVSLALKGKHHSEKTKLKMSLTRIGKPTGKKGTLWSQARRESQNKRNK